MWLRGTKEQRLEMYEASNAIYAKPCYDGFRQKKKDERYIVY